MENIADKAHFLKDSYTAILTALDEHAPRKWGKMNVRQMIEHMSEYVRIASGRARFDTVTPEDRIPRMQAFLATEKPFMENTPNPLLPDEPTPAKLADKATAIAELQSEIDYFFEVHNNDSQKSTPNPFFGTLGFEQQVQLLHKHATHHLRQFGQLY